MGIDYRYMKDVPIYASEAKNLARNARISIVKMTHHAKASHVGSALSVVDILSTLYSSYTKLNSEELDNRDYLILSKGHSAAALYAVLAEKNFFPKSWLDEYCSNGAPLGGHVTSANVPGVSLSTGSLGHGLPYGMGIALGLKMESRVNRVYVVMSDGECDEGTTWESALISNHFALNNLCVIIDRNRIQSLGLTENTIMLEPLKSKWESFGWEVRVVDGHSYLELLSALEPSNKPLVILADTIKGFGVSFMENSVLWHYKSPNIEELEAAIQEILSKELS